eukprot:Gb_04194 [translate_table: standard]
MFFSGDPSSRKRVDLGGRSSKERDRQKLLEQTRLEREQRLRLRNQTLSAIRIQKYFRGRKAVAVGRLQIREQFCITFGQYGERADRNDFKPSSEYLRQLLFFFRANDYEDFLRLVEACRLLHKSLKEFGNIVDLFTNGNFLSEQSIVEYRVKLFVFACLQAVHQNREQMMNQLLKPLGSADFPGVLLLETVIILTDSTLPWAGKTIAYLLQRNTFVLLRDILLTVQGPLTSVAGGGISCLERVVIILASQNTQNLYNGHSNLLHWSFPAQILSIPFLWKRFTNLKQVFVRQGLWACYIQQMANSLPGHLNLLPPDTASQLPGYACLLGNILEVAGFAMSQPNCTLQMAMDFATVSRVLLEELPYNLKMTSTPKESNLEDDMEVDEDTGQLILSKDLEQQILCAVDSDFLKQLVRLLFGDTSSPGDVSSKEGPSDIEAAAVGAVCAFLHVTFTILPLERVMTGLAYTTELVPTLWHYMKRCHLSQRWPTMAAFTTSYSGDAPGWMLPLSVFCPVYRHMLMIVDNEEFYEQQKPLSLADVKDLVIILKEALWQLLWVIPSKTPTAQQAVQLVSGQNKFSLQSIQAKVSAVAAELLAQLQDWNSRRQFTSPYDFHAREAVDEIFFAQARNENTRAYELLKQAPFLVPFTNRVRIYTSQLATARQHINHIPFTRHRVRIRRDRIVEDAFSQLNVLTEEELRGMIRVTFVNEFGVEEPGVDGGGIFKDFMENITKTAFDIQYGLFKETADHLLYPNPASGMIHEQHLQYFDFLGKILGKAMFDGILVDIPFATFFLSKLKNKYNYLHDLPSLDPELYRHLLFLKHYEGDVSQLGLYFVIVNNEYGEQTEEELLPGGKDIQVTNANVIMFIHLVANHRLNSQIRNQSSYFLRGFQQLIQSEWIGMFNEHELQLLISGSLEGLDVDDLRSNVHYAGGYHEKHPVIEIFWEVIKKFNLEQQKKFLKFVTGCSRGPLLGFRFMEPQFCIQRAAPEDAPEESLDRLPTSATCMNLLKLPPYRSKEALENKLIYAITADAGFDLS